MEATTTLEFMKRFSLVLLWMTVAVALHAQDRLKRKADAYYDKLSYELAIPYYEHYLKKKTDDQATMRLAQCYRLTHDYPNAAKWYDKVILISNHPPISYFYYGHALLQTGDLENAKDMFSEYAKLFPEDPRGVNFMQAIAKRDQLMEDSARKVVTHLPFNSSYADFGTYPYQEGIIIASAREVGLPVRQSFNWLDTPFLNFFWTNYKKDSSHWEKPDYIKGDVNTRYHESNFTMAKGATEFYFTRNNFVEKQKGKSQEGVIKLKLYKGTINGLETSNVEELPFNSDQYSCTHPSISADGKTLYFVSDMPGGEGGKDIYYVTKEGNGWSAPVNVEAINTPGDEVFPYVHPDGTLYFSSDGHPGLGHLDIFSVKPGGNMQAENMGYPINTAYDDFAFYLAEDHQNGFLSSDRPGGEGGDDIYKVQLMLPALEIIVMDSIADLPIIGAKLTVTDMTNNSRYDLVTDSTGKARIETYFEHTFEIVVETEEFETRQVAASTFPEADERLFTKQIDLSSPPPSITAIVIDEETKKRLVGAEVEVIHLRVNEKDYRKTDANGRVHLRLDPFTYYEMNVRYPGYLAYSQRVSTTKAQFEGDTIIPLRLEKIVFNKPIRLENIKYDFDKWTIRADAYNDLLYLADLMKKNPTIIVELGSHTDSRGSDEYNESLSQKRANAARYFLVDQGIDPTRIKAKGYGESQPSNCCMDGQNCSEEEHQRNRRTEFKIIGTIDGIDMDNSTLATDEGQGFKPEDCPKYKGKPAPKPVKPTPIEPKPVPVEPEKPKRDTIAAANPLPGLNPVVVKDTRIDPFAKPIKPEDTLEVTSGRPTIVTVEGDQIKVNNLGDPTPAPDQKGNRSQPVVKTDPEVKPEPVAKADPAPVAEPKTDGGTVMPVTGTVVKVERDSASVANWLGDSDPKGNEESMSKETAPATATFTLPAFKTHERNPIMRDTVTYRVQLGAFRGELSEDNLKRLDKLAAYVFYEPVQGGVPRCFVGEYLSTTDVKKALSEIQNAGYPNAFITGFKGSRELTIPEIKTRLYQQGRI